MLPEALEAMAPLWADCFGNPSSVHEAGNRAARMLRQARREVALLLGARDENEIVFTSGGTESNNAAIRSVLQTSCGRRRLVTTAVEHSSVLKLSRALAEEGVEVLLIPVDFHGSLDRLKLREALESPPSLVSVMMANNETGVLFPIDEIAEEIHSKGTFLHVDAVQAVGKIPLCLKEAPIDFLSLSGHKLGGPKGVGVLYVRQGVSFRPLIFGGSQERGRRAGTENVPGIVGLGAACRHLREFGAEDREKMRSLRDEFEAEVLRAIPDVGVNGDPLRRLPNTSNLAFEGVDAEALLILLDQEGIYASSGSACLSGSPEPSHVLKAMGFSEERAKSSVRFSFGPKNTREEVTHIVRTLVELVGRLRQIEWEEQHPHPISQS